MRRVPVRLREKAKFEVWLHKLLVVSTFTYARNCNPVQIDPAKRKKFMKLLRRKTRLASGSKRTERFMKRQSELIVQRLSTLS